MLLQNMTAAAAVSLCMVTSSAFAATASYDFTALNSGLQTELFYSDNGIDLSLTTTGGNGKIQTWKGAGLGAPTDSHHQVDSYGIPETINLLFSTKVKITNITFSYVDMWDDFELFENGVSAGIFDVMASVDLVTGLAESFGIAAVGSSILWTTSDLHSDSTNACYKLDKREVKSKHKSKSKTYEYKEDCYSAFKITGLTVETVPPAVIPLPAAGFMLMAGLGGLAALRRRKKA